MSAIANTLGEAPEEDGECDDIGSHDGECDGDDDDDDPDDGDTSFSCADKARKSRRIKLAASRGMGKPAGDSLREKYAGSSAVDLGKGGIKKNSAKNYAKYEVIFLDKMEKLVGTRDIPTIHAFSENATTRKEFCGAMKELMFSVACASVTGSSTPLTHFCGAIGRLFKVR